MTQPHINGYAHNLLVVRNTDVSVYCDRIDVDHGQLSDTDYMWCFHGGMIIASMPVPEGVRIDEETVKAGVKGKNMIFTAKSKEEEE